MAGCAPRYLFIMRGTREVFLVKVGDLYKFPYTTPSSTETCAAAVNLFTWSVVVLVAAFFL